MINSERYMSGLCPPYSHQWQIIRKHSLKSTRVPFAIFSGADPLSSFVCAGAYGRRSEADYAGALRKAPVELIKCETNDLFVPAHAEIILEGEILLDASAEEGPFGEFTGYSSDPRSPKLLYRVDGITHRNNPILTMSCPGIPTDDSAITQSLKHAELFERLLRKHGVPFTGVYVPPQAETFLAIVGVKTIYPNIATLIGNVIASAQTVTNQVIVVDEDVDVFNMDQVLHALFTKCHPIRGITASDKQVMILTLAPYLSPDERSKGLDARVVFDCTWPLEWPKETSVPRRVSFNEAYPDEIKSRVEQNWQNYGFK
jgi:4-hydroxy-3-polyprenylbenzoate decarboxylase